LRERRSAFDALYVADEPSVDYATVHRPHDSRADRPHDRCANGTVRDDRSMRCGATGMIDAASAHDSIGF
jgi:hypothetical protein